MKKTTSVLAVVLATLFVSQSVLAAEASKATNTADIQLREKTTTDENDNNLLKPEFGDHEDTIFPSDEDEDKRKDNKGSLVIDYVSNYHFATEKISGNNTRYFAKSTVIYDTKQDQTNKTNGVTVPNFIQVTDDRGTNAGWTLKVQQTKAFTVNGQTVPAGDTTGLELKGTELTIKNLNAFKRNSNGGTLPSRFATGNQVVLSQGTPAQLFASAQADQGTGSMAILAGNVVKEDTADKSIELAVPGHIKKQKDVPYQAELTWILETEPSI